MSEYAELVKELARGPFLDLRCTEAMSKSAAAITALEAQVKELREALEKLANAADMIADLGNLNGANEAIAEARAVLAAPEKGNE